MVPLVRNAQRTEFLPWTDSNVYVVKILKHPRMGSAKVSGKLNLKLLLPKLNIFTPNLIHFHSIDDQKKIMSPLPVSLFSEMCKGGVMKGTFDGNVKKHINCDVKGKIIGHIFGNINGNMDGEIVGNIFGSISRDVNGKIRGNIMKSGSITGNVNGDIIGNVFGHIARNITGRL